MDQVDSTKSILCVKNRLFLIAKENDSNVLIQAAKKSVKSKI